MTRASHPLAGHPRAHFDCAARARKFVVGMDESLVESIKQQAWHLAAFRKVAQQTARGRLSGWRSLDALARIAAQDEPKLSAAQIERASTAQKEAAERR